MEAGDAPSLARLAVANRDFVAPFEPDRPADFYTEAGQVARVADLLAAAAAGRVVPFVILDDGEVAGGITLSNIVRFAFQSANVGYWVDQGRNGRGLASRALAAVLERAFGELGLHRVEAGTLLDNRASQRVLEKNGFTRIGVAPRYLHIAGAWRDHVLFQRLADD